MAGFECRDRPVAEIIVQHSQHVVDKSVRHLATGLGNSLRHVVAALQHRLVGPPKKERAKKTSLVLMGQQIMVELAIRRQYVPVGLLQYKACLSDIAKRIGLTFQEVEF